MKNKLFFIATLFSAISIVMFSEILFAESETIRIYLKIFDKRDSLTIENPEGLFMGNNSVKSFIRLEVVKKDANIECDGKPYATLHIRPKGKSLTRIITTYGVKSYDGSFTIRLKEGRFYIFNTTSMNSYLQGVVGSELGEDFSPEVLKAQAVVSRSYFTAVSKKSPNKDYDAVDVAGQFQAFRGLQYAGPRVKKAVMDTRCEVIRNNDEGFIPQFHSTCGGMLLAPEESWGKDEIIERPGFRRFDGRADSPNCRISPYFQWTANLDKTLVLGALSKQLRRDFSDIAFSVNGDGFLKQVKLTASDESSVTISGFKFKSCLEKEGISSVRSTRLAVRIDGGAIHFRGKGFGHFVGLCQWGAEHLARNGMGYRDILRYYYPASAIVYLNECR